MVGDGDMFEIEINPDRPIEQITMKYNGQYTIPVIEKDGSVKVNDEGKIYYKDGMYVTGFVENKQGQSEISVPKFIDAHETDNWYHLGHVQGSKIIFKFHYRDSFRNDAAVIASKRKVKMQSVLVRYKDPVGLQFEEKVFNNDDEDSLSEQAKSIEQGSSFTMTVPANKHIFRVDVRWGDAKPRQNGVYVPGYASGRLKVNGNWIDEMRNVAAIETQVWNFDTASSNDYHKIELYFYHDLAKIHWIKVYYK